MALQAATPDSLAVSMIERTLAPHSERKSLVTFRWITLGLRTWLKKVWVISVTCDSVVV